MDTSNKGAMIRRFIAMGLTLLALLFMFWPAIASVKAEERHEYIEAQEWWKEYKKEHKKSEMINEAVEGFMDDGFSKSDAKKAANASYTVQDISDNTDYSLAQLRSLYSASATLYALYEKYNRNRYYSSSDSDRAAFGVAMAVLLNISFWSLLVIGIGAMVLYFFNKTRALGIVFTVLAFLNSLYVIIMLAGINEMKGDITVPGASMFLIPMFALAACIVYKRTATKKAAPARAYAPANPQPVNNYAQPMNGQWAQPQPAGNQWSQPQPRPVNNYAQQPANNPWEQPQRTAEEPTWFCPACGAKNPKSAGFCSNCGTKLS